MRMLTHVVWVAASLATGGMAASETVGLCRFDTGSLAFAGTPVEQARCLLRPVMIRGRIGEALGALPPTLDRLVGTPVTLTADRVRQHLRDVGLSEDDVGGSLDRPVSRGRGGQAGAPLARYFVIHDTSSPYLRDRPFPPDDDERLNSFAPYMARREAHLYNNRLPTSETSVFVMHEIDIPWRATRFEMTVGIPSKGMFIHVENVQPRRRDPQNSSPNNDNLAPMPGFTAAQYQKLALFYVAASRRAGTWMIPAYHAVLDAGIGDHDDPQNFDLSAFDSAVAEAVAAISVQP